MNQKGFVTTEFLFAVVIAFGLTIMTFAMTFTLSVVEVSQYMVFAASRAQSAAHLDQAEQRKMAEKKYNSLLGSRGIKPLFTNGWYEISSANQLDIRPGNGNNFEKEYGGTQQGRDNFQGVRATFKANILEMRIPLVGNVTPEDGSFSANINALLIREVSQKECEEFTQSRLEALRNLDGSRFSRFNTTNASAPWEDNGC